MTKARGWWVFEISRPTVGSGRGGDWGLGLELGLGLVWTLYLYSLFFLYFWTTPTTAITCLHPKCLISQRSHFHLFFFYLYCHA